MKLTNKRITRLGFKKIKSDDSNLSSWFCKRVIQGSGEINITLEKNDNGGFFLCDWAINLKTVQHLKDRFFVLTGLHLID